MSAHVRIGGSIALIGVLALGLAGRGDAAAPTTARLVTPALQGRALDVLGCRVVNASAEPVTVQIAAVDLFGTVVDAFSANLAPGDTSINSEPTGSLPLNGGYCVFTGEFRKSDIRASAEIISDVQTVAVAAAQ